MKGFKFLVPPGTFRPLVSNPAVHVAGHFAIVVADTEDLARARLVEAYQQDGDDYRWLEVADVKALDLVPGAVLIRGEL